MKPVIAALGIGTVLLYFVNAALKFDLFTLEMLVHSAIRFFTGFIILGIGYFYEHKLPLKVSLYLVLGLVVADDILDYVRQTTRFSIELILYGVYMLLWGSAVGYLFIRFVKIKLKKDSI